MDKIDEFEMVYVAVLEGVAEMARALVLRDTPTDPYDSEWVDLVDALYVLDKHLGIV